MDGMLGVTDNPWGGSEPFMLCNRHGLIMQLCGSGAGQLNLLGPVFPVIRQGCALHPEGSQPNSLFRPHPTKHTSGSPRTG
jgi:hypothetical protein